MFSAVFLPFALVHFFTPAILTNETSASQIFYLRVFTEKTTGFQFFTFLSHISLLKLDAETDLYKTEDTDFKEDLSGCFTLLKFLLHPLY